MSSSTRFEGPQQTFTEPIVGWRAWIVTTRENFWHRFLMSSRTRRQKLVEDSGCVPNVTLASCSSVAAAWLPDKTNVAEHLWVPSSCRGLLGGFCQCGFWAFKDLDTFRRLADYKHGYAIGRVSLWGKVVVCNLGYRAEKAYPLDIWLPGHITSVDSLSLYDQYAQAIRETYKIEVYQGIPWLDPDFKEDK